MGTALTAASAAGVAGVWQGAAPAAADFFQDTALLAGAAAMPEGTLGALRRQLTPSPSSAVTAEISPGITFTDPEPEVTDQKPVRVQPPEISPEYRGVLISETMAGSPSAVCWQIGAGSGPCNYTEIPRTQIDAELSEPLELAPKADGRVEVLIMHTHATESYEGYDSEYYDTRNTWRSTDNNENMVAVGNVIEEELRKAGIGVVHDTQQFDYPSYNGSYDRAAVAVKEYLAQYPDIQLILDVHRDGIQRDATTIVKPATEIDGEPAAQIMILCGSDPGGRGLGREPAHRGGSDQPAGEPLSHPDPTHLLLHRAGHRWTSQAGRYRWSSGQPGQHPGGSPHLGPAHRAGAGRVASGAGGLHA